MSRYEDVIYKMTDTHPLYFDLEVPEDVENPPLIMWIHGGGWKDLNRKWNLVSNMSGRGYAVASIDYRYSDEDCFPADIIDCKDALWYLRKHAAEYGYDPEKIIVAGDSAGGHLAELVGVSIGNRDWEREEEADYGVCAVISFAGAVILGDDKLGIDNKVLTQLIGVNSRTKTYLSRVQAARPVNYINGTEPPFLLVYGTEDEYVAPRDPRTLRNALEEANVPVHMYYIPGGHHGNAGRLVDDIVCEFLDYYVKNKPTVVIPELQKCHDRTVPLTERYIAVN